MDVLGWIAKGIIEFFGELLHSDRTRSTQRAFGDAIEELVRRTAGVQRAGRWVATVDGLGVELAVVASAQHGETWFAEVRTGVVARLGSELVLRHAWKDTQLPSGTVGGEQSRSFPALDAAWIQISRHRAPVAIHCDGRQVVGWIDEPLTADDVDRVARAVAAIARWDAGYARFLERFPDATTADDDDLSPAVRLAPDGARIGLRRGTETVVQLLGSGETVWPEVVRDRDRLLAAVDALRSLRGADGPYR